MKSSFNSSVAEINRIHADIKNHPSLSLREEFALGHGVNWDSKRNQKLYDHELFPKIIEYMREGKAGDFKDFGLYDRAEIWKIWKISVTVPLIDRLIPGVLDRRIRFESGPTAADMMSASEVCQNETSTLLAIKAFVIRAGLEDGFYGYQPQTNPVSLAEYMLFGKHLSSREHKDLCCRWAKEFGTTPSNVNTFIWIIGMRIRESQQEISNKAYSKGVQTGAKSSG